MKSALEQLVLTGASARKILSEIGGVVSGEDQLRPIVREVIRAHPEKVTQFLAGKKKLMGFLMGQVMKRSQGKADPKQATQMLLEEIESIHERRSFPLSYSEEWFGCWTKLSYPKRKSSGASYVHRGCSIHSGYDHPRAPAMLIAADDEMLLAAQQWNCESNRGVWRVDGDSERELAQTRPTAQPVLGSR